MHQVSVSVRSLSQSGQPVISIRRVIKESNHSIVLDPKVTGIKHAILDAFISEPFTDLFKGFCLPLQLG